MTFLNEYRRLYESITQLWKTLELHQLLPFFERLFVTSLLDREVTQRENHDQALLYKMSQYLIVLQSYHKASNRAMNLAEERESKVSQFMQICLKNNLHELEDKGVQLILLIRSITIKLLSHIRQMQLTQVNEQFRVMQSLFRLLKEDPCYICSLNSKLNTYGRNNEKSSMMTKKLGLFLKEKAFFTPISKEQMSIYIEQLIAQKRVNFTITELSMYEKICHQLYLDTSQAESIERNLIFLNKHYCSSEIPGMNPYEQLCNGCFIKFDWQLPSMNVLDWRFNMEPNRENLRDRMNDAFTLLRMQNAYKATHQSGSLSNINDSMQHILHSKLQGQEIIEGTMEASMRERYVNQDPKHYDDESIDAPHALQNDRGPIAEESDENKTPPPQIPRMLAEKSGYISGAQIDEYASGTYSGIIKISAQRQRTQTGDQSGFKAQRPKTPVNRGSNFIKVNQTIGSSSKAGQTVGIQRDNSIAKFQNGLMGTINQQSSQGEIQILFEVLKYE